MIMVPIPALLPKIISNKAPLGDGPLVAFGDINYDGNSSYAEVGRGAPKNIDRGWLAGTFGQLKNTGPEVDAIGLRYASSFPNSPDLVFKQNNCSEEQFRRHAPKARWLHLATHGFFAPDLIRSIFENKNASVPGGEKRNPDELQAEVRIHPGLLSGLALAGANFPGKPDEDDGILSSMEVSSLNLSNVELAVLSACQTAQGKEAGGEGVLGLQRAFQVAGARSVMGTLWSIDDAATRLLMMRFYRNLWEKKMGKLESLREAQIWMIKSARNSILAGESPKTGSVDSDKLPPHLLHPSIWAPFVLSGDWN
jgi:CHAT domain-containing protein